MTIRSVALAVTLTALVVSALGSAALSASELPSEAPVGPPASAAVDPADFSATVDNPWFPLVPGTTLRYEGTTEGKALVDVFEVTHETALIDDVPCVVIRDTVMEDGTVVEETVDWYSQDLAGNVWYFGEDTRTLGDEGNIVSTEGTWQAGVDGAQPGIFMPAEPRVGQSFQQESYPGHAEDWFVVLQAGVPVEVPYGSFPDAMVTGEWTPLEPDVLGEKVYARGIGLVRELDVAGSDEVLELVRVTTP
jgi:hypothetical protein